MHECMDHSSQLVLFISCFIFCSLTSTFLFLSTEIRMWVWNNMRVSKWWQNIHFWMNYFFKHYYGNDVDDSWRNGQNIAVVKRKLRWRLLRSVSLLRGTFPTVLWTLTEEPGKVIFPISLPITLSCTLSDIFFLPLFFCPFFAFFHKINEGHILWSIPLSVWSISKDMFSIWVMKVSDCPNGSRINKALGWWMFLSLFSYFRFVMLC